MRGWVPGEGVPRAGVAPAGAGNPWNSPQLLQPFGPSSVPSSWGVVTLHCLGTGLWRRAGAHRVPVPSLRLFLLPWVAFLPHHFLLAELRSSGAGPEQPFCLALQGLSRH